jgi:hypothetical protein
MDEAAVFKQAPVFMARFGETARQQLLKSTPRTRAFHQTQSQLER